jgi:hypothetical protein
MPTATSVQVRPRADELVASKSEASLVYLAAPPWSVCEPHRNPRRGVWGLLAVDAAPALNTRDGAPTTDRVPARWPGDGTGR